MNFYPNFGAPDFLSPISGRVLCDYNYVLVGNYQNIATPSPILIDIRLDLAALLENLANTDFVIGHPKPYLPTAQVLVRLPDGYMYNTKGIVSTKTVIPVGDITLTKGHILVGDSSNKAVDTPFPNAKLATGNSSNEITFVDNITLTQMAPLATNSLWSGDGSGRPAEVTKLILDQMSDLSPDKFWKGNASSRPIEVSIADSGLAPADATYYIREPNAALPNAQALRDLFYLVYPIPDPTDLGSGALAWMMGITQGSLPGNHVGQIRKAVSGLLDPLADYVSPTTFLDEFYIPEWLPLVAEVEAIQAELVVIEAAIAVLQGQVIDLYLKAARPLNVIATDNPTTGDVDFNNHKAINLTDATNPQDAVNLRTLESYIGSASLVASSVVSAITPTPAQILLGAVPDISSHNFTTTASSFIYTGTKTVNALVNLVCQIVPDIIGDVSVAFYLNGTSFAGGVANPYLTINKNTVVVQGAVKLVTGDEITIYGASAFSTSWTIYNINWAVHVLGIA